MLQAAKVIHFYTYKAIFSEKKIDWPNPTNSINSPNCNFVNKYFSTKQESEKKICIFAANMHQRERTPEIPDTALSCKVFRFFIV